MLDALAEARVLILARVVARGVEGEDTGLAGVPVAAAHAPAHALGLVDDVEAVARRADRGADAAAVAARSQARPEGVIEVVVEPLAQASVIEREVGGDAFEGGGTKALGLRAQSIAGGARGRLDERGAMGRDEGRALVGEGLDEVAALDRRQATVGAALRRRIEEHRAAETGAVFDAAGQAEDRGRRAACVPELVGVVPVHDVVDDRQGGRVAGSRAEHDLRGVVGRRGGDLDLAGGPPPREQHLGRRQEELLEGEARQALAQGELGRARDRTVLGLAGRARGAGGAAGVAGPRRRHRRPARRGELFDERLERLVGEQQVAHLMNSCVSSTA